MPVLELPNPEPVPKPELWLVCPNPVPPPPKPKDMVSVGVEDLCFHREEMTVDGANVKDKIDVAAKANEWWRVWWRKKKRKRGRRTRQKSKVKVGQVCQLRQAWLTSARPSVVRHVSHCCLNKASRVLDQ